MKFKKISLQKQQKFLKLAKNNLDLEFYFNAFIEQFIFIYLIGNQINKYKLAILQESERAIKHYKETNQHDKYIEFKIGDEFEAISGKGSFNKMKKEGLCSDTYDENQGYIYPVYSASVLGNHICSYSKKFNPLGTWIDKPFIKVTVSGDPGKSIYVTHKSLLCEKSYAFLSEINNHYIGLYLNKIIPSFSQGSAQKNAYFPNYKNEYITIPANHEELSKKIAIINKQQEVVNKTLKQMEKYIDGVLQMSIKDI